MQILETQSALLSNHEVLQHLQEQEAEYTGTDGTGRARKKPAGLKVVLRDSLSYLTHPMQPIPTATSSNTAGSIYTGPDSLFLQLKPHYRLTKAEYLQLYNLRPKNQAELEVVIEEGGSRFTEEQLEHILRVVQGLGEVGVDGNGAGK